MRIKKVKIVLLAYSKRFKQALNITSNPSGGRCPEIACCPTQAIICEMLINEPLEPQTAIVKGALCLQ